MDVGEFSIQVPECPEASDKLETQIRQAVDELICFVRNESGSLRLMDFERSLWPQMAVLFRFCVAMYTLRRGKDGKPHGPINKKIFGQFGPRKDAIAWARAQATRRGFGPETDKTELKNGQLIKLRQPRPKPKSKTKKQAA